MATLAAIAADFLSKLNPKDWFGKSPDQTNYDNYRAGVWASFAKVVDALTIARQNGTLNRTMLQQGIDTVVGMMASFKTYTDSVMAKTGASWVTPRFHDYYDFMNGQVNGWRTEILTLPAPSLVDSIGNILGITPAQQGLPGTTTTPTVNQSAMSPIVIIGLLVGAYFMLGRRPAA